VAGPTLLADPGLILASSWHQSWICAPGWAAAIAASFDPSPFFERGPRGRIALWVPGPRFLARQPERLSRRDMPQPL
jgi:hypothetical protein